MTATSEQLPAGHWLETFIEHNGDSNDYNDGDDVQGWLSIKIAKENTGNAYTLTVTYTPDGGEPPHPPRVETYLVSPMEIQEG